MAGKHYGWHKEWSQLPSGRLHHSSGLEFDTDGPAERRRVRIVPASLEAFYGHELQRGVRPDDLKVRIARLTQEARNWRMPRPRAADPGTLPGGDAGR